MSGLDWEQVKRGREMAGRRLLPLHRIPMIRDSRMLLLQLAREGDRLLDVGANDRNVGRFLKDRQPHIHYFSFDIDRSLPHDYYALDAIDKQFELSCLFDVIEHLPPGGQLLITTPNVDHPVRFWRDCTHVTPFRYDELAGFLTAAGYDDVRIWRVGRMKWQDRLRRIWAAPVLRLLGIDYAPTILAIGRNKNGRKKDD